MISTKMHEKIRKSVALLQRFTDRFWYAPLIGLLAALDNLIVIIPNDGILISSSMLIPKRWVLFAVSITVGSTLGAVALALIVRQQGLPWILDVYPGLDMTRTWQLSMDFFESYGLLLVFIVALTPIMQQPAVILASLGHTPIAKLAIIIFAGRLIKYLVFAYLGSHAPKLLKKMWGLREEIEDAGVKL